MPDTGRSRLFAWWLLLALAVALLLGLFAYATATGLSGTGDSRSYLFAAQSWRKSGQLLHPDGTPYRHWAPLFPLLLNWAGSVAGLRALHAAALAGALLLWADVGRQVLPTRRALAVPLLLAGATAALVPSRFVWAETELALLWAGFGWALLRWRRTGGWRAFGLSAGVGLLLPLQHNTGTFLLLGIGAALQLERPAPGAPGRGARVGHAALTLSGALLWHLYVLALPFAPHSSVNLGLNQLSSSLADYGFVLLRWLLPLPAHTRAAVPAGVWATGLLMLLAALWPRQGGAGQRRAAWRLQSGEDAAPAGATLTSAAFRTATLRGLWLAAVVTILLLLLATVMRRSAAGVHDAERYVAVLYPVVVLLVLHQWPAANSGPARRLGAKPWCWLSRMLLAVWLLYAGVRILHNAQQLRQLPPYAAWQLQYNRG